MSILVGKYRVEIKLFNEKYKVSLEAQDQPVVDLYKQNTGLKSGVYEKGLITIIGKKLSERIILDSWEKLPTSIYDAIAYTAFGDLFVINKQTKLISFFEVQYNQLSEIEIDLDTFFNDFMIDESIRLDILRIKYFLSILDYMNLSGLRYEECLVLKPWLKLGGKDAQSNYVISNFPIYFDLVNQS